MKNCKSKKTIKQWKYEFSLHDEDVLTNPLIEEIEGPENATMTREFFKQIYNIKDIKHNGAKVL